MPTIHRRSAPKVRDGQVQKKNRSKLTPNYLTSVMPSLVIDRRPAPAGYRHVVRQADIRKFIEILPNWDELKHGLDAIVIDGATDCMGWHSAGVVAICAWAKHLEWNECDEQFLKDHQQVFDKLAIPVEVDGHGKTVVRFAEESAKAFLLVHVLVHELGHHHDLMTTRSKKDACRGESYAESFARQHEDKIIARYQRAFKY